MFLVDTPINTVILNITVFKGKGNLNTTVMYNLTQPYSGITIDNRNTPLTIEQEVNITIDNRHTPGSMGKLSASPSLFTPGGHVSK